MFSHEQYTALREGAGLLDRSDRGRLRLTGSDRRNYLQGLLTNDIAALSAGDGCYAAFLTAQGRMISDMRVSELGDAVLLDLPASTSDTVRQRLSDFIFSEDVEVVDVTATLAQFGVYGPEAAAMLETAIGPSVRREQLERMECTTNARFEFGGDPLLVVRSDDYGVAGFELFAPAQKAPDLDRALRNAGAMPIAPAVAEITRVEAGRPEFGADMDEHTIPLEAGIEDRAISLTKGCYVGQEIIIRVLHRGHGRVAKRLVGFVGESPETALERGDRLVTADAPGKEVGSLTSAVRSPLLQRPIALGYVQRDYTEPGTVLRTSKSSGQVTVVPLPIVSHPTSG